MGNIFIANGGPFEDAFTFSGCTTDVECRDDNPANRHRVCVMGKCLLPTVTCAIPDERFPDACRNWRVDHEFAILRTLKVLGDAGVTPPAYDQLVIWDLDIPTPTADPRFRRLFGKNTVGGLGLPVEDPPAVSNYKFTGYITAGSTRTVSRATEDLYPCKVFCEPGYYNLMDALARATAGIYAPYAMIKSADPVVLSNGFVARSPERWSALLDTKGSLLGGNTWRDHGDGTFETDVPPPLQGAIPPFEGTARLSFSPLDLYLLGFAPKDDVSPLLLLLRESGITVLRSHVTVGPEMGIKHGVLVRPKEVRRVPIEDVIAGSGPRDPDFAVAPHHLRQFWIGVTFGDKAPAMGAIARLQSWRDTFSWYFYMMTHWRGRVVTTFEADVDDSPYWEFGQPVDDRKAFVKHDVTVHEPLDGRVLKIDSAGAASRLELQSLAGVAVRIEPSRWGVLSVRMRIPSGGFPVGGAHALASFPGGPSDVRLPDGLGEFLVPDGQWHTYSANLEAAPGWLGSGPFNSFTFAPSDVAASGIEIDSIRFTNAEPKAIDAGAGAGAGEAAEGGSSDADIDADGEMSSRTGGCGCAFGLGGASGFGAARLFLLVVVAARLARLRPSRARRR